jgi:hypothetical protein
MKNKRLLELAGINEAEMGKDNTERLYKFLIGWAKKGTITKTSSESNLWTKDGKMSTKLMPGDIDELVKYGFATLSSDGFTLTLKKK